MELAKVEIIGFRNFKNATINLQKKSLILGANDVGKTNFLWALRLLLDRSLSDLDIEPKDSDFFAYETTNTFTITLKFTSVTDECVVAKMKGKVSDKGVMYLRYIGIRDPILKTKSYTLYAGSSIKLLEAIDDRYYRKTLNLKYISSKRDFYNYINKEKGNLIFSAKESRTTREIENDAKLLEEITQGLSKVDGAIPKLSYIASATNSINSELNELSIRNSNQSIVFDANSSDADRFINNVSISSRSNDQSILIGGDGRLNQIYLALWAARNELSQNKENEVSIICIEEPEAHLHPHQQRKLAEYLNNKISGQVILTSHSPQIASEFSPNSIARIYNTRDGALAASDGCSEIIEESFIDFGFRMSIIPAEAFFCDVVFLIEGPSELYFYKTLSKQLGIDLDQLNISILMVDGVDFPPFMKILNALKINWVLRTDNDIFKIPHTNNYRYAGIERCISYCRDYFESDRKFEAALVLHESNIRWPNSNVPPKPSVLAMNAIRKELERYHIFVSAIDLENDIYDSGLQSSLQTEIGESDRDNVVKKMQYRKAKFMYQYIKKYKKKLKILAADDLAKPLIACKEIVENLNEAN